MQKIYYSRQNYNKLKRKHYEEYIKRRNRYYLYRNKYYEEYLRRQRRYYLYKRKQYEEYFKRKNRYYLYRKKYYEEYLRRQNRYYLYKKNYEEYVEMLNRFYLNNRKYSKIDTSQSKYLNLFKNSNNEEKYIMDNSINNFYRFLESNIEIKNLDYKKDNLDKYIYLENKNGDSIEVSYDEEYLEKSNEKFIEETDNRIMEEKDKEHIEEKNEDFIEESYNEFIEVNNGDFIVERDNDLIEERDKGFIEENYNEFIEEDNVEFIEDNSKEFLGERDEEFLSGNCNTSKNEELYVKFPVILAETSITISVEDTITLNQEVNEIIRNKKNVFLTKSRLIPFSSSNVEPNSGILFIKGFIRNNIEYKTQTDTAVETVNACGDIRHCIFEVPFNFTTRITFLRSPIFIENTTTSEVGFLTDEFQSFDFCTDSVIEADTCERCFMFSENFNEKPFVELVKATFNEVNISKSVILCKESITEEKLTKITEKIILSLILRVLQKQEIRI